MRFYSSLKLYLLVGNQGNKGDMVMLYNEIRPVKFNQIVGQEYTLQILRTQVIRNSFSRSYIFAGTRGTGKTTIARILAKASNCSNPSEDGEACGCCQNCLAVQTTGHPDIIEIDAASNSSIEMIRKLIDQTNFSPIMGKRKVFIIDEVHMLSKSAFDAMLKTLEESKLNHCLFILCSTELHKIPKTIKSRSQLLLFKEIDTSDIYGHLLEVSKEKKYSFDKEAIHVIAKEGNGSMRDALSILEQCSYLPEVDGKISAEQVNQCMGFVDQYMVGKLLYHIGEKNVSEIYEILETFEIESIKEDSFVNGMNECILDVIRFNNNVEILKPNEYISTLEALAPFYISSNFIHQLLEILTQFKKNSSLYVRPYIQLASEFILLINSNNQKDILENEVKVLKEQVQQLTKQITLISSQQSKGGGSIESNTAMEDNVVLEKDGGLPLQENNQLAEAESAKEEFQIESNVSNADTEDFLQGISLTDIHNIAENNDSIDVMNEGISLSEIFSKENQVEEPPSNSDGWNCNSTKFNFSDFDW